MIQVLVQALCWTLIHSLWQGLLASVLAGGIVMITKKYSAGLRYTLLTVLFFGLVGVFGETFLRELDRNLPQEPETAAVPSYRAPQQPVQLQQRLTVTVSPASGDRGSWPAGIYTGLSLRATEVGQFCSAHAVFIVALWMLILALKLARMGADLGYIHRLRRSKTTAPPAWWTGRVRELGAGIGLRRPISLMESALTDVPMVIGFFKPMILVPLGILSRLPADQLEAVLLHELAHIRRKDYLINLLQNFIETIFFFNPAILWISGLIREERENCCDDVAIGAAQSKAQLIHALVAFQEFRMATPAYAIAFPGRKNQLLDRVKRIVYNRNKTLNAMEKVMLASCLLIAGAAGLAFSPVYQRDQRDPAGQRQERSALPVVSLSTLVNASRDTLPAAYGSFSRDTLSRDTVPPPRPPVAPVSPVSPVVPVSPASPVAPVSPVSPVAPVSPASPVAPVSPVSPIAPTPAAPVPPVSPVSPVAPVAPIAPVAPASFPSSEISGGNFEGALDMHDGKVTYADGIWKKGNTTKYFSGGMEIVQENGVLTRLYIDGQRIPDDQTGQYERAVQSIISHLVEQNARTKAGGASASASYSAGSYSSAGTYSQTSASTTYRSDDSIKYATAPLQAYYSQSTQATPAANNSVDPIIADILSENLARGKNGLSFTLNYKSFVVNGVTQPREITDRFRQKYVLGKKDAYAYTQKDNSITSVVTIDR